MLAEHLWSTALEVRMPPVSFRHYHGIRADPRSPPRTRADRLLHHGAIGHASTPIHTNSRTRHESALKQTESLNPTMDTIQVGLHRVHHTSWRLRIYPRWHRCQGGSFRRCGLGEPGWGSHGVGARRTETGFATGGLVYDHAAWVGFASGDAGLRNARVTWCRAGAGAPACGVAWTSNGVTAGVHLGGPCTDAIGSAIGQRV